MKFVLLVYQGTTPLPGTDRWNALPEAEKKQVYADYAALGTTPGVTPGLPLGLPNAARTVRVRDGKTEVTEGPSASEAVAGFSTFECETMDEAIALAAKIPAARLGGCIEIRMSEKYW